MKIYAGIGSRRTPSDICQGMVIIAKHLAEKGYTLRSGGAEGADSAFEYGCDQGQGKKEIYLPWKGFNGNPSPLYTVSPEAIAIARGFHPTHLTGMSQGVVKLMGRNTYQVLGSDLQTPVDFVACWTPNGDGSGGTGQAIRIARSKDIPVFDFGSKEGLPRLKKYLGL